MKKRKKEFEDDGRTIVPMNVAGMPWHTEGASKSKKQKEITESPEDELNLTAKEKRAMMGGVIAAALLVAGVFILAGLLFILFCVFVWFK